MYLLFEKSIILKINHDLLSSYRFEDHVQRIFSNKKLCGESEAILNTICRHFFFKNELNCREIDNGLGRENSMSNL